MGDLPDWTNAVLLQGETASGDVITLLVGDDGQLYAFLVGEDGTGTLHPVRTDTSGQLIIKLVGDLGVSVSVNTDGYLTTVLKGWNVDTLRTLMVDVDGRLEAKMVGYQDSIPRVVTVDSTGQLIMVPRGQSGNYMSVDADGFLAALMKGVDGGATLRTIAVDTGGQLIMVPRGQSGYYMNVDSDGYLTMILKGAQDGTLTTIAVDTDGRIEAFILDAEDQWGKKVKVGNSELAARLGSVQTYDWRGQMLYFNTFEHGRGCFYAWEDGDDADVSISPDYWLMGGYSLKMLGGSTSPYSAKVRGIIGINKSKQVGLQVCWSGLFTYDYVTFTLSVRGAASRFVGAIKYNPGNGQLYYYGDDAAWHWIATPSIPNYPYAFNHMKVVIDIDSSTYLRCLLGSVEYDLGAYALETDAGGYVGALEVEIEVISTDGNNYGIYLDHFAITLGEPQN